MDESVNQLLMAAITAFVTVSTGTLGYLKYRDDKRLTELAEKVDSYLKRITELETQVLQLQNKCYQLETERNVLQYQVKDLQADKVELQQKVAGLEEREGNCVKELERVRVLLDQSRKGQS